MNSTSIEGLIQTSLDTLKDLGFKNGTIKRHRRHLFQLREYMRSKGQIMYDESVGEKYLLDMLTEGNFKDYLLKETRHSINLLADTLNHVPARKKRILLRTYAMPGELGKHVQDFLTRFKVEIRPRDHTMHMYMTALSHFAVRMQQDSICLDNLDKVAISRFISSLQNTQLRVCVPVRRFLYIPVENHTKFQLKTIPLINAYLHSFFTNERRIKNDKYEYKTEDHSSQVPRWLFRTQDSPGIKDKQGNCSSLPG